MRTLNQIEPRTPIASLPFVITECGSYYLTKCLEGTADGNGIVVQTGGVTIDLNGFTLRGGPGSLNGILVTPGASLTSPVRIRNGQLAFWGGSGIRVVTATNSVAVLIDDIVTSLNAGSGVLTRDIPCTIIKNSYAWENAGDGFNITDGGGAIFNSCAERNEGNGINVGKGVVVNHCSSYVNEGHGIRAIDGCTVTGSTGRGNGLSGIFARGSSVDGCSFTENQDGGIVAENFSRIENNSCVLNEGAGIRVAGASSRIRSNHLVANDIGLEIAGFENVIEQNVVQENGDNYTVIGGNHRLNILLSEIPESIDWPATVTFAGTLVSLLGQDGLTVTSHAVTIDLDGHALVGSEGSLIGIDCTGSSNLVVRNGTVRDWGSSGIRSTTTSAHFHDLQLTGNGGDGLQSGPASQINRCTSSGNTGDGFETGEGTTLTKCVAQGNTRTGIHTGMGNLIERCIVSENGETGVFANVKTTVRECTVLGNAGTGIQAISACHIVGNHCSDHATAAGIRTIAGDNRIEANQLTGNSVGLDIDSSGNLVIRNTVSGSTTTAYEINANNLVGPVIAATISPAISGSSGGAGLGSTDPWANFTY